MLMRLRPTGAGRCCVVSKRISFPCQAKIHFKIGLRQTGAERFCVTCVAHRSGAGRRSSGSLRHTPAWLTTSRTPQNTYGCASAPSNTSLCTPPSTTGYQPSNKQTPPTPRQLVFPDPLGLNMAASRLHISSMIQSRTWRCVGIGCARPTD